MPLVSAMPLSSILPARGEVLQFEYPEKNLVTQRPVWQPRCIVVEDIIDTTMSPIPSRWFLRRPLIRRGRHLVVGCDLDKGERRQFYLCAMRGVEHSHWLSLALYDPCTEDPVPLYPDGPFAPTVEDRLYMAEVIEHYNRLTADRPDIWLCLGVFPWRQSPIGD
jgi:hypothetical protein